MLFKETGNYIQYLEKKVIKKNPWTLNIGVTRQKFELVILIISKEQNVTILRPKGMDENDDSANNLIKNRNHKSQKEIIKLKAIITQILKSIRKKDSSFN